MSDDDSEADDGVYIDDRFFGPWKYRSDCVDCDASNPSDAPCCGRCGGVLACHDEDGEPNEGAPGTMYPGP